MRRNVTLFYTLYSLSLSTSALTKLGIRCMIRSSCSVDILCCVVLCRPGGPCIAATTRRKEALCVLESRVRCPSRKCVTGITENPALASTKDSQVTSCNTPASLPGVSWNNSNTAEPCWQSVVSLPYGCSELEVLPGWLMVKLTGEWRFRHRQTIIISPSSNLCRFSAHCW